VGDQARYNSEWIVEEYMRILIGVLLAAGAVFAADSDYNGRWDITASLSG